MSLHLNVPFSYIRRAFNSLTHYHLRPFHQAAQSAHAHTSSAAVNQSDFG